MPLAAPKPILSVANLRTWFHTRAGIVKAVDDLSFTIGAGETLAIVGESGCGKSMTALSLMRLIPPAGRIESGSVRLGETDLLRLSLRQMRALRGKDIAMIFQEPMTSLNPVLTVGRQIAEAVALHRNVSRARSNARTPSRCCNACASPNPNSAPANIPTRCPAACASAR